MSKRAEAMIGSLASWVTIDDPRDVPSYSVTDAARYLRIPAATVRSWAAGRPYHVAEGRRQWSALIEPAQSDPVLLSFLNLVELHVLRAMRRVHKLKMPIIRKALDYVGNEMQIERPLIQEEFSTDGVHLLVKRLGEFVSVSEGGQQTLRELLEGHLVRIERDEKGLARRLFPFVRDPSRMDDPMVVMIDPRFAYGRPALRESGVATRLVLERYLAGESAEELARDYDRPTSDIEDALRSEYQPIAA